MMQLFLLLVIYPLWFFTGLFPRSILPKSFNVGIFFFSLFLYFAFGILHYGHDEVKTYISLIINLVLVLGFIPSRWTVSILLGWAASDAIYLATSYHSDAWDWILFAIVVVRSNWSYKIVTSTGDKKMSLNSRLLSKMIALCATEFQDKLDKGGKPYILHCLRVMNNVGNEDVERQIIAVGHDLIEDTKVSYRQLKELGFSDRVVDGIRALTKVPGQTQDEYEHAVLSNLDACYVKLEDLRDNSDIHRMKGLSEKDFARLAKYHHMYARVKLRIEEVTNNGNI